MGPDTLGPLIPIAALMIPIVAIWTKHRTKIAELQIKATAELSAEKAAQYAQHTRELEERVRVLERIVTDKGFDTAAQIEALRRDSAALEDRRPQ
jgi:Fe2+ transport system protein B